MKKITLLFIITIFTASGFVAGIFYGFKEGVRNHALLEQVVQGSLSRHQLAAIEKDQINSVQHLFELNIDTGLHRYSMYEKSGNKLLSEIFMPELSGGLDKYIDTMAEYRKSHPIVFSPDWAKPVEGDDEKTRIWRARGFQESEEMLSDIKQLLRSRGSKK